MCKTPSSIVQTNRILYRSQAGRVAFVSYPRSGSNWACTIISEMLQRAVAEGQTVKLTGSKGSRIFNIDSPKQDYSQLALDPNWSGIVKTHLHWWDKNSHVIYMFRDARETLASYRHWHRKKFPEREFNSWSDWRYVRVYLRQLVKEWCKAAYFALRHPQNIVFIRYRDLLHQPNIPLTKLASFLGVTISMNDLQDLYLSNRVEKMQSKKPSLVYRSAKANRGHGDFSPDLLRLIAVITWAPYSLLCVLSRRRIKARKIGSK